MQRGSKAFEERKTKDADVSGVNKVEEDKDKSTI